MLNRANPKVVSKIIVVYTDGCIEVFDSAHELLHNAESAIRDTDMAEEML